MADGERKKTRKSRERRYTLCTDCWKQRRLIEDGICYSRDCRSLRETRGITPESRQEREKRLCRSSMASEPAGPRPGMTYYEHHGIADGVWIEPDPYRTLD